MYYNARWYDPALGHFTSPDSIIPVQSQGTQAWDRFAYANNNALRYNDPTGHCPLCVTAVIGGAVGAIVGAVGYTAYVAYTGKEFNTGHMLLAAGGGAVAGALIGTGVGWVAAVGAAEATIAATTTVASAETANVACGGDMCAGEAQNALTTAENFTTLYHGSVDSATEILKDGLDIAREGATYVSTDIAAAQDAISSRAQAGMPGLDPGIITSKVPTAAFNALQGTGEILGRAYQGFYPYTLNSIEYLLKSPAAKGLFNQGIQ